jgi:hypothetical protein
MTAPSARRLAHGILGATALLWLVALILTTIDRPAEAVWIALLVVPLSIYATLGALLARSHPQNPIGWLFSGVGLTLVLWVWGLACALTGLRGEPGLSDVPGAALAAWTGVICGTAILPIAFPTFLLIVPDGRPRSRRWFEVRDDGRGFDLRATGYGTGLQGMADRLSALGGQVSVESEPGSGTSVRGWLPARTAS